MPQVRTKTFEAMNCNCAENFRVRLLSQSEYRSFKTVLDKGGHPAFIGRTAFERGAQNGGALLFEFSDAPAAVSLINPHTGVLIALNVMPAHRGHGLGAAIVRFLIPNFVRSIESRVAWFGKLGYVAVGKSAKGQSLRTQVMARKDLFSLVGKLQKIMPNYADNQPGSAIILSNENIASDAAQKMVRPDFVRRKNDRVSRDDGILARATGRKKL